MLAQMAATAGSVAVGSTIGHGISHMLFGGSSAAPAEPAAPPVQQQSFQSAPACEAQAKDFTRCLDKADLQSCSYYLEQLKAVCVCPPAAVYVLMGFLAVPGSCLPIHIDLNVVCTRIEQ